MNALSSPLLQLRAQLLHACPGLSTAQLDDFLAPLSTAALPARAVYLDAGQVPTRLGLVSSGLLRAVYTDAEGRQTNVNFIREGMFAVHYQALVTRAPSKYCFQCIEFTQLVEIPFAHLQASLERAPALERYVRLGLEKSLFAYMARTDSLLIQDARTRYEDFTRQQPELFRRLSVSDLCSYLGIQRQTLTRIRKQLLTQKK